MSQLSFDTSFVRIGSQVLSVLEELLDIKMISFLLLKETGIGKAVNSFRKHEGKVGEMSRAIVFKWKELTSSAVNKLSSQKNTKEFDKKGNSSTTNIQQSKPYQSTSPVEATLKNMKQEKVDVADRLANNIGHSKKHTKQENGRSSTTKSETGHLLCKIKKEKAETSSTIDVQRREHLSTNAVETTVQNIKPEKDVKNENSASSSNKKHVATNDSSFESTLVGAESGQSSTGSTLVGAESGQSSKAHRKKSKSSHKSKKDSHRTISAHIKKEKQSPRADTEMNNSPNEKLNSDPECNTDIVKAHEGIVFSDVYQPASVTPVATSKSSTTVAKQAETKSKKVLGLAEYKLLNNIKKEKPWPNTTASDTAEQALLGNIKKEQPWSGHSVSTTLGQTDDQEKSAVEVIPSLSEVQCTLNKLMEVVHKNKYNSIKTTDSSSEQSSGERHITELSPDDIPSISTPTSLPKDQSFIKSLDKHASTNNHTGSSSCLSKSPDKSSLPTQQHSSMKHADTDNYLKQSERASKSAGQSRSSNKEREISMEKHSSTTEVKHSSSKSRHSSSGGSDQKRSSSSSGHSSSKHGSSSHKSGSSHRGEMAAHKSGSSHKQDSTRLSSQIEDSTTLSTHKEDSTSSSSHKKDQTRSPSHKENSTGSSSRKEEQTRASDEHNSSTSTAKSHSKDLQKSESIAIANESGSSKKHHKHSHRSPTSPDKPSVGKLDKSVDNNGRSSDKRRSEISVDELSKSAHKKHKRDRSEKKSSHKDGHRHSSRDDKEKKASRESRKRKASESDGIDGICDGQSFEDLMSNMAYTEPPKKKKPVTLEEKIAKTVAKAPLPKSYLDDLPELLTDYKPLPKISQGFESSQTKPGSSSDIVFTDIKAASRADAVYSGRRRGTTAMHSLSDLCIMLLGNNIDDIGYVGGVPYSLMEPVLKKATPKQLFTIEDYNADFTQETDPLWKEHCAKDFKGQKSDEFESWRELYLRKYEEREKKLEMLQNKISAKEQQKQSEARKSMVAYAMSSAPKPPREVRRQQAKYGTGSGSIESTARASAIVKHEQGLRPFTSSRSSGGGARDSKSAGGTVKVISVPPLMKKAKKFMSKLNR